MVKHRDLTKIVRIREILEDTLDDFPGGNCDAASMILNTIFGWELRSGYVYTEKPTEFLIQEERAHQWVFDPTTEEDIDISLDQFPEFEDPIYVLPKGNGILIESYDIDDYADGPPDYHPALLGMPDIELAIYECYRHSGLNDIEKKRLIELMLEDLRSVVLD